MAKYILKNKDTDVLSFETIVVKNEQGEYGIDIKQSLQNINILNSKLLPLNLKLNKLNKSSEENLLDWFEKRKAPNNRQFIEKIIATYSEEGQEMPMDYIDISLGLSLNDSFWVVPANENYQWKDYNLYDNAFNKTLEHIAFGELSQKMKGVTSSPEYTTNGMLPKCWHRENEQIYLYKGSSTEYANMGKEAYGEYYMAQIAGIMEFKHIPYDLKEFHGKVVSSCPIFTNENEGYANISCFLSEEILTKIEKKEYQGNRNQIMQAIIEVYGRANFENLMIFDALIYNTDRHLGNFGMIVDNNTNEVLRPAPIFDNGLSILNRPTKDDLPNIKLYMKQYDSYFRYDFDEQLKIFVKPRHIKNLKKLTEFRFKKHPKFNLSDEWLKPIESHIRDRANLAINLCKKKFDEKFQSYMDKKDNLTIDAKQRLQNEILKEYEILTHQGIKIDDKQIKIIKDIQQDKGRSR